MTVLHVKFVDDALVPFDLLTHKIDFQKIQLGEIKRQRIQIQNVNRTTIDINITAIQHPTAQIGPADQTYLSCAFAESDIGPWFTTLVIPSMSPGEVKYLWIEWYMPTTAVPGYAQFAVQAIGKVVI